MTAIQGDRAHDATDRGSPVKIGGKATGATPTAVAAGDRVDGWFDLNGRTVIRPDYPSAWAEDGVGTNAGVTVTHAAAAGNIHRVAAIQCSGDAAAVVTVESPAATVLYTKRFAAAFNMSEQFPVPIAGSDGGAVLVKISASTANCEANIQGYTVPS